MYQAVVAKKKFTPNKYSNHYRPEGQTCQNILESIEYYAIIFGEYSYSLIEQSLSNDKAFIG